MVAALFLIMITYFDGWDTGWQREPYFFGKVITWLTLPFLLLCLVRGLPRWAATRR